MSKKIHHCVLDANIRFSLPKRDLILSLAKSGLLKARWTRKISDETQRALEKRFFQVNGNWLRSKRDAVMTVKNINSYNPSAIIDGDFSSPPSYINLPDKNDNHVLYEAIKCEADYIVTENLKDFPQSYLLNFSLKVATADEIISDTIGKHKLAAMVAVEKIRKRMNNPPVTMEELLELWSERHGLTETVKVISKMWVD